MRVFHAPEDIPQDVVKVRDCDGWTAERTAGGWHYIRNETGSSVESQTVWQWHVDALPVTEVE